MRWLPAYRRLEAELEVAEQARVEAEDQVRQMQAALDQMREERDTARRESQERADKITDWMAQRNGHPPVFGHRYENQIPAPQPIRGNRRQARDLELDAYAKLEEDFHAASAPESI